MLEKSTYYILDAQGNHLSIYEHSVDRATNTAYYYLTDRNIYGSSRLGVTKDTINMFKPYTLQSYGVIGNRNYELTDHRGNVQTVINDIKYPLSSDNTTIDSYEVGINSIADYSPFGVQLDGRTIDNVFYHPESTVDTVSVTAYALEETFDIASNWQEITTETQITYPSGKMRVRNPMSNRKKIGVKNEFITGEGLHSLSFEITYLPYTLCPIIVFPGEPIFPSQTNDSILDSEEFHIQSVKNSYLVFEIFDENSISILIDSTRSVGTYSYNFTALEGENYSVLFYINSLCNTRYFEIDNVFITYEEEAIVENTNAFIATNYRYSVQNQEHHDEIRGKGNYINYKYCGHDPRIGRLDWLIDPLSADYPWNSPYAFSENSTIAFIELEGLEKYYAADGSYLGSYGTSTEIRIVHEDEVDFARTALNDQANVPSGYFQHYLTSETMGSTSFANYAQNVNDVLNDATLETWANNSQNCYTAACKQMSNAGQSMHNKYQAIQTDVDNTLQPANNQLTENSIGGAIYTMTQLKAGNPVMVGVKEERSSDGSVVNVGNHNRNTGHFVVISSMQVNNGAITFGYYDNASEATGKSADNRFDVNSGTGAMQDNTNVGVGGVQSYTVSEVRKNVE